MERRRFLERAVAGAIVGIGGAGAIARACAGEEEGDLEAGERASTRPGSIRLADRVSGHGFRTSCAAYSFRRELSGDSPSLALEDFIDLCAKWGLDGTELTSYYFRETEPAYLSTLRRRATV
ncbi:MAG TPA: hypothetical protein VK116_13680, partial [Planctomycetota bacterium]|nr:hypothetical protein [Planctomycetota bacterium]